MGRSTSLSSALVIGMGNYSKTIIRNKVIFVFISFIIKVPYKVIEGVLMSSII